MPTISQTVSLKQAPTYILWKSVTVTNAEEYTTKLPDVITDTFIAINIEEHTTH